MSSSYYFTFYNTPQWKKQYNTVPNGTTSGAGVRQNIDNNKNAFWGNPTYYGRMDNPRSLTCMGLNNCGDIRSDNQNWLNEGFNNTSPNRSYDHIKTYKEQYNEMPKTIYPQTKQDLSMVKEGYTTKKSRPLTRWMFIGHVEPFYSIGKYKFPLEARQFITVSNRIIYQYRVNNIYTVAYEPEVLKENQIINVFMNSSYPEKFRVKLLTDQ